MKLELSLTCKVIGSKESKWAQLMLKPDWRRGLTETEQLIQNAVEYFQSRGHVCEADYITHDIDSTFIWVELPSERYKTLLELEAPSEFDVRYSDSAGPVYIVESL